MKNRDEEGGVFRFIGKIILGLMAAAAFALVIGALAMVLWNWVMAGVLGLAVLTYWQAFGIVLLAKLLFGFGSLFGHGKRSRHGKHWCESDGEYDEEGDEESFSIGKEIGNGIRDEIRREIRKEFRKDFRKKMDKEKGNRKSTGKFDDVYENWWDKEGAKSFDEYMKQNETGEKETK